MAERTAMALTRVRQHLATLGYPVDDLTDEQLQRAVQLVERAARATGTSLETLLKQTLREVMSDAAAVADFADALQHCLAPKHEG